MSVFLFPGQGSQAPGMGRDFYERSPDAREVFDLAAAHCGPGYLARIFDGPGDELTRTCHAQPALLTVEVAILRFLGSRGIRPSACAGHSLGEFSALVAADALDFESALAIVQVRARLMAEMAPRGGMMAILGVPAEEVEAQIPESVEVANYNGPEQTIISGTPAALDEAENILKAAGLKRVIRLQVSGPFHSSLMQDAANEFRKALTSLDLRAPQIRFISSVRPGEVTDPEQIRELLGAQMCAPVCWTEVMRVIGPQRAIEVGPGRVLQGLAKRAEHGPQVEPAGTLEAAQALEGGV
ncbi:MAG: ACP S-malonyltransferase [Candidatus Hydrogenedentes bacterium]|nr:ACP S-malonyltransferase [Candidatus Hydrogenedentota bacterium]